VPTSATAHRVRLSDRVSLRLPLSDMREVPPGGPGRASLSPPVRLEITGALLVACWPGHVLVVPTSTQLRLGLLVRHDVTVRLCTLHLLLVVVIRLGVGPGNTSNGTC
jgi:hypothetical protein